MKVYSYCSYEGSPCGFVLGALDASAKEPVLSKEGIPSFVANAFYCGIVDFVFGNVPGRDSWLVMVKNLSFKEEEPSIYVNLAFETTSWEEYRDVLGAVLQGYKNIQGLSQRLSRFAKPRKDDTGFGLSIDMEEVASFLAQCKKEHRSIPQDCQAEDRMFLCRKTLPDAANKDRSMQLMKELCPGFGYVVMHESQRHRHVLASGSGIARSVKDRIVMTMQKIHGDAIE